MGFGQYPMYQPMGMNYPAMQPMQGYGQPEQYRQPQQSAQQQDAMIWVQGEAGAKAYMVAPQNSVVLWDSEANAIYIKSADANGVPYMRVFDYTERNAVPRNVSQANTNQFVTREEFNALAAKFEQLIQPATGREENSNAE